MKKLAAISIAVSMSATVLSSLQPANGNQIRWRTLGYNTSGTTSFSYDENFVNRDRSGDIFLTRVSGEGKVFFLGLSCSKGTYAVSPDNKNFESPRRIPPRSAAAKLHEIFCQSDYNRQISEHNRQMNEQKAFWNTIHNVSEPVYVCNAEQYKQGLDRCKI